MPRQLPPPPPQQQHRQQRPRLLDSKIWQACAGASVKIPSVNSRVYYFPQGHMDQASSPPQHLSSLLLSRPYILCRIVEVQFLADSLTDEVFAKLSLHPVTDHPRYAQRPPPSPENDQNDKVVSFGKILTPSDANNGGGFSVPRFCADSIFPALDFNKEPPFQNLSITDVHGVVWTFRHIYRGTPRRHLLTTGWSKFVNSKKLVAGDSVVFIKNPKGDMFVGIRRAVRFASHNCGDGAKRYMPPFGIRNRVQEEHQQDEKKTEGFSRNGKGKLSPTTVQEAAELAAQNMPCEVVYYPRAGWSEFVVKAEVVDAAMSVVWSAGMRVKMSSETDDSSRITWFQGTISGVSVPSDIGPWRGSPWRMLQVKWDEPEVLQNSNWVSPWQVELVATTPALAPFPTLKKLRAAADGEGDPFSMTRFNNSTMGHLNQTLLSYGTFPAGMQGARHDLFSASSFSNLPSDNSRLFLGNSLGNNSVLKLNTLSTELNVGCSQSDDLSPDSQSSLHSSGTEFAGHQNCTSTKSGSVSFQLFGAVIETKQPVESDLHCAGCTGDNSIKGCNETESIDNSSKGCNETESVDNPMDHPLTYSKLLQRLDKQCQRASTVEACYL